MVTDHFMTGSPKLQDYAQWPQERWNEYAELRRKAALYDEMTKQRDCPDPAKTMWHEAVEKFMREKYGMEPK